MKGVGKGGPKGRPKAIPLGNRRTGVHPVVPGSARSDHHGCGHCAALRAGSRGLRRCGVRGRAGAGQTGWREHADPGRGPAGHHDHLSRKTSRERSGGGGDGEGEGIRRELP